MLHKFLSYIEQKKLIQHGSKTLLAVSGGKDSMVMLDLMIQAGMYIEVGHINHHLRGEESEEDALFVKNHCKNRSIPYHQYDIDPYLLAHGNLQDKARQIRYQQFAQWASEHNCQQIATAHHLNDRIETFLMFAMRGTGLDGMASIAPKQGQIIRPLLWATSDEISAYIRENNIPYREDSSNASDKYLRNQVRHHIIPAMMQADSRALQGLKQTIQHMESTAIIFDYLMKNLANQVVRHQRGMKIIDFQDSILPHPFAADLLYQLIKNEGFNFFQCSDMVRDQRGHYYTTSHEAILHQKKLIIRPIQESIVFAPIIVDTLPFSCNFNGQKIKISFTDEKTHEFHANNTFFLDATSIQWPLTFRMRAPGDTFRPYGMEGKSQKVKDYLINRKLSAFDKEAILILEDASQIVSVLPLTIANGVQVHKDTKNVVKVEVINID